MIENCIGCDIARGKVIPPGGILFEDPYWIVNHVVGDPHPLLLGMFIVQPKRHVEHIHELTLDEIITSAPLIRNLCLAVYNVIHPQKIYVCSFGDGLKHVHFIILPRTEAMPANGRLVFREVVEEKKWTCTEEDAIGIVRIVKKEFLEIQNQDS